MNKLLNPNSLMMKDPGISAELRALAQFLTQLLDAILTEDYALNTKNWKKVLKTYVQLWVVHPFLFNHLDAILTCVVLIDPVSSGLHHLNKH